MRHAITAKRGRLTRSAMAFVVAGLTAAGTVLFVGPVLAGASDEEMACAALSSPVYQRVNPANTASMLTTSTAESAQAESDYPEDRGVQFAAASEPAPGLIDVRDLQNPRNGNMVYIRDGNEARNAVSVYRFVDRGVAFYASAGPLSCTVPVYRYRLKSFHRHVVAAADRAALASQGWVFEGISFYAAPAQVAEPTDPSSTPGSTTEIPVTSHDPTMTPTSTNETSIPSSVPSTPPTTSVDPSTPPPVTTPPVTTPPVTPPPVTTPPVTTPPVTTPPVTTPPVTTPPVTTPPVTTPPVTTPPADPADTKFSIAIMPDTQQEVFGSKTFSGTKFLNRSQWLVDNAGPDDLDLKYVTHTGDVVNWDTPNHDQYEEASAALAPLTVAGIPYSLSIGNHDSMATGEGGSARDSKNTRTLVRDTTTFNTYFTAGKYSDVQGEFEPGKVDNIYSTFVAGGENWMVVNLELWPRVEAVEWAKQVVAGHPDYNVIVVTHSYLEADGSITQSSGYGATSGQYLFDNLISQYSNIKLVFSGHVGTAASRTDVGATGNKIYSFLTAIHSNTTNPVRLVEIDTAAGTLTTKIVAPYDNATTWRGFDQTITNIDWVR